MSTVEELNDVREAVGVFNGPETFQSAIDELLSAGFHRSELSLLADENTVREKLGHQYGKAHELADNPDVPRVAYVSPEAIGGAEGALIGTLVYVGATAAGGAVIIGGGALAATIAAVALASGVGGLIGTILAKIVGDHHARYLQDQMEHGGLLLWVRTWNAERERRAIEILQRNSGSDVHVHSLPVAA
jgi:hypothetical protein